MKSDPSWIHRLIDVKRLPPFILSLVLGRDGEPPTWRVVFDKVARDDIFTHASALSYSTLASLVPLFAIVLALLSAPAFESNRDAILDGLAARLVPPDTLPHDGESPQEKFKATFRETIEPLASRVGAVSVFGFMVLLLTIWLLIRSIESTFNAIWQVRSERQFFVRVSIATSLVFWFPTFFAISISLSQYLQDWPWIASYIVPLLFTMAAFTAFYMVMPHARVHFSAALLSGLAAGIVWEAVKFLFLVYVTRFVSYQAYGSLGLMPMLFVWMYLNWLVILAGAEMAYVLQHRHAMFEQWKEIHAKRKEPDNPCGDAWQAPPVVVLAVAFEVARRFQQACPGGAKVSEVARELAAEPGLIRRALRQLAHGGIVVEVVDRTKDAATMQLDDPAYVPSCDPHRGSLIDLLRVSYSNDAIIAGDGPAWVKAREVMEQMSTVGRAKFGEVSLAELVKGVETKRETIPWPAKQ